MATHSSSRRTYATGALLAASLGFAASPLLAESITTENSTPQQQGTEVSFNAKKQSFNIAPQLLSEALIQFGKQSGLQVSVDSSVLVNKQSSPVQGAMTAQQAINSLLRDTGLIYQINGNMLTVVVSGDETMTLSPLQVSDLLLSESARGPVSGYVAKRSATGTKTDTSILETAQSVSVIGRDELDMFGVQNVTEALRYVPGVSVDQYGSEERGYEYVYLRGFNGLYTANYRDGLNQASGLYFAAFLTETYGLERIDVLRGPASVLFGNGDAGGIVNRISKTPDRNADNEVQVQLGRFDRKKISTDIGGAFAGSENIDYRLVASGLDSDTQIKYKNGDSSEKERVYLAPSLRWRFSDDTSLTLRADLLQNSSSASPFYAKEANGRFTNVLLSDPGFTRYEQDQYSLGYEFEHRFNDTWALRQNFRFARQDADVKDLFRSGFVDGAGLQMRNAVITDETIKQTQLDTMLEGVFDFGTVKHKALVGLDVGRLYTDLKFYRNTAPSLNINAPQYNIAIANPTTKLTDRDDETDQLGVYLQDQMHLGNQWIVTLNGRHDDLSIKGRDHLANTKTKQIDSAFTTRAAVSYKVNDELVPYFSYAESFLPQSGQDVNGKAFEPTRAEQYEVGIKYQPVDSATLLALSVFDLTKSNTLTRDISNPGFSVQTGEVRSRGIELEARGELTARLNIIGSYTYNDVENTENNDGFKGNRPIQTPERIASVWLDYALMDNLKVGAGARYVAETYDNSANTKKTDGYTLIDAAVHYDFDQWRFSVNASNLLDKEYFATKAFDSYYVGAERNIVASLTYHW